MTIAIDKAFQARWTAESLDSTVAGGLWFGLSANPTDMPYASYSVVSDVTVSRTHTARYNMKTVQIQVWDTTADLVGAHIGAIEDAFVHGDRDLTAPLRSLPTDEIIKDCDAQGGPIVLQEADEVWQALITLEVLYAKDRVLIPS